MSRVDLSEFLDAYLGEVEELLAASNAQLLALEAALRSGEPTLRPVRELFRALHTVKGLSAMVGVDPIVAIAHRLEAGLRNADRAGGRLPEGAIDLMLRGVAAIEQRVKALAEGGTVPAASLALLEALDALEDAARPPRRVPSTPGLAIDPAVDAKLAAFEREVLARGVARGLRAICAWFTPSPERAASGANINTLRERLGEVGEIVKVVPISAPRSEDAPAGLRFALLALTPASVDEVAREIGLEPGSVTTIAEPGSGGEVGASAVSDPLFGDASGTDEHDGYAPIDEIAPLAEDEEDTGDDGYRRSMVRVDVAKLDETLERLSQLVISRASLAREIGALAEAGVDVRGLTLVLREQTRQLRDLRAAVLAVRMVPVGDVLERVPLILRGLRRATGKAVRLELDTGRAELDKAVAERLFPAIVHLVRNAVDHAIEAPEERRRAGKPEDGRIRIASAARGNGQLEIVVDDDGRGIDGAELARLAGREPPTSETALLQLLCQPGLTTRDEVSTTSGRGMGMDIVRGIVVDQLGGELLLSTALGRGTRFTLRVPLTLSIVDALTFECAAQRFVVPSSTIDEIVELDASEITTPPGASALAVRVIQRRGQPLALVRLDQALGMPGRDPERPKALVVRRDGELVAFAVDRMLGQQEVVVRPLEDPLCRAPGIAGATDLGDGRPTLVIDLLALGARLGASGAGHGGVGDGRAGAEERAS